MLTPAEFDTLVDGIYGAAIEPERWSAQLRLIAEAIGASGVALFAVDARSCRILFMHVSNMPIEQVRAYSQRYLQSAPHIETGPDTPSPEPGVDLAQAFDGETERSAEQYGLTTFEHGTDLAGHWNPAPFVLAAILLRRNPSPGQASTAQVALLRKMLPHVRRGVDISHRLTATLAQQAAASDVIDRLPYGVVMLDSRGRARFCNRAAETMFAAADGVIRTENGIAGQFRPENRRLQKLIAATIADPPGPGGAMTLLRPSGKAPYAVTVAPVTRPVGGMLLFHPAALIYLTDREHMPTSRAAVLSALYGLTAKETEIATLLGAGLTLDRATRQLAMPRETARHHLKALFRKTATNRQTDLVRLLLSLPAAGAE